MYKIDKRRNYKLVIDIEAANIAEDALAYDVGFAVTDKHGTIYETYSFMVAEMFFDHKDLMDTAYYAKKLPKYWEDYKKGTRKIASIYTIKKVVRDVMEKYNISDVYAYNAHFDVSGLNRTVRYLTKSKSRWFFPYGTNFHCIWNMACQTIYQQKTFAKVAHENKWFSSKENVKTSAEIGFRYLTGNTTFQEEHMGLEDVLIETQIMAKCFRQHRKMTTGINRSCWKLPQEKFKTVNNLCAV